MEIDRVDRLLPKRYQHYLYPLYPIKSIQTEEVGEISSAKQKIRTNLRVA